MSRTILLTSFAMAGVCLAAGAQAQTSPPEQTAQQEHVSYFDLDLSGPAGAKTLMTRLHRAANDVCGRWDAGFEPSTQANVSTCVRTAVALAVKQVDRPELTALRRAARDQAGVGARAGTLR